MATDGILENGIINIKVAFAEYVFGSSLKLTTSMKFTHLFFIGLLTKVYTETVTVLSTRSYRLATTELTPTDGTVYLTLTRQQSLSTSLNASTITTPPLNLSASVQTTAVTDCHFHNSVQYCVDGYGNEGSILPVPTNTNNLPTSYDGCHSHDGDTFCMDGDKEVQFVKLEDEDDGESSSSSGKSVISMLVLSIVSMTITMTL